MAESPTPFRPSPPFAIGRAERSNDGRCASGGTRELGVDRTLRETGRCLERGCGRSARQESSATPRARSTTARPPRPATAAGLRPSCLGTSAHPHVGEAARSLFGGEPPRETAARRPLVAAVYGGSRRQATRGTAARGRRSHSCCGGGYSPLTNSHHYQQPAGSSSVGPVAAGCGSPDPLLLIGLPALPVATARPIVLTAAERQRLKKAAWGHKTPHQARVRARIVLLAARGRSNARIAVEAGVHVDTVRTWRGRFADLGLPGLADRKRPGRPAVFTPLQAAQVKALACQLPAETGAPLSRWSCPELAREATARGIAAFVSASTVRRWLAQDALKPWQYRSWIFITDPLFRPKAQQVLDLYARTFDGVELGKGEYVISAGEKTSIQARCRCHPTLAPGQARAMRVNHTYGRGGALAYLAAYDVHQAKVFGRTEPRTGIDPFMNLVTQVMSQEPYASAKRVFWIVDNDSSHRGQRSADRLAAAFPNAVLVHTPVHASWLNQVEIYFSVVQRLAQRLHRHYPGRGPAPSLRRPLQRHSTAVPVEVHRLRPGRSAGQARPAHRRSPGRILTLPRRVINPRRTSRLDHLACPTFQTWV
ncbi:IS630 family transposase [Streptomyces sp. TE3672]